MKKSALVISGVSGRMGQELVKLAIESGKFSKVIGVDRRPSNDDITTVATFSKLRAKDVDVIIDFSSPELFREAVAWAGKNGIPIVSGTTGLTESDRDLLKKEAKNAPILWAANMSIGIALVNEMIKLFCTVSKTYDFQIEEIHHSKKKDAPSGTAIRLQETLRTAVGRRLPEPLSMRGGGVPGMHRVIAMGEEDTIIVEHNAFNRTVFARGAMRAADWILKKKAGRLYEFQEVLN